MSKSKGSTVTTSGTPMTQKAASRITSAIAKANGGSVPKNSVAARAERAANRPTPGK